MSGASLAVLLDGRPAGEVRRGVGDDLQFRYYPEYAADPYAVPLSVCMPLTRRVHPHRVISPWLWGLLPDHDEVRREWGASYGVTGDDAFDLLATPVGRDCAGAVQFCKPDEVNYLAGRDGHIQVLSEYRVAELLRDLRRDDAAWINTKLQLQFSLAGGQRKTALHFADGSWGVPTGATPTTHILKPTVHGLRHTEINEHLCLTAARRLGLPAAVTSVAIFEDQTAVVVQRFDRFRIDGELYRAHQEDLCQALAVMPAQKYEDLGGPDAGAVIEVLRRHAGRHARDDIARFVDCLALNWLLGGTDAHAKNYTLLLDEDAVRLAPLYDVISVLPYRVGAEASQNLAMRIGGHRALGDVTGSDWMALARVARLDPAGVVDRVLSLAAQLPDAFEEAAADPAVRDISGEFADHLTERVSLWQAQCVTHLGAADLRRAQPPHRRGPSTAPGRHLTP